MFALFPLPLSQVGPPYFEMIAFLGATVLMLVSVVWLAKTGYRRQHITLAILTLPILFGAIHYAGAMDAYWNFPKVPLRVHLSFAISATGLVFLVSLSGFFHLRGWVSKKVHARLAWTFLVFVLLASITGAWIFIVGEPK